MDVSGSRVSRVARRTSAVVLCLSAMCALAPSAAACPTCGVAGSGIETLAAVMGFLLIPYVIVSGVWFWMKRVIATESEA